MFSSEQGVDSSGALCHYGSISIERMIRMQLHVKRFQELTLDELYAILKLRVDVFVVEQSCPYAELDGLDRDALHIWLRDEDGIKAYVRVLDKGVKSEHAALGRVIAVKRRMGLGTRIVQAGLDAAREYFGAAAVYIEAQTYARGLYEKLGFRQISGEFLEDGIPHIQMLKEF
jgi:ElaA protein